MEGRLKGDERRVGDFDCVWDDGPVAPIASASKTFLVELSDSLNLAASIGQQLSQKLGGHQQVTTGNGINGRSQQNNTKPTFAVWLPLPPLNSYLGCLPMRRYSEDKICASK